MEWNAYNKSPKERSEAVRNYKKWAHEKYLESMAEEKAHRHRNSSAEVNKRLQEDNRKRQAAYDERKRLEKEERLKEKERKENPPKKTWESHSSRFDTSLMPPGYKPRQSSKNEQMKAKTRKEESLESLGGRRKRKGTRKRRKSKSRRRR